MRRTRVPGGARAVVPLVVLALLGWWRAAPLPVVVALTGVGGLVLVGLWRRHCLTGVSYERRLARHRALFGEEVPLETVLVNDKVLPLTWLQVEDELAGAVTVRGGTVARPNEVRRSLTQLLPLLPYQRVTRHLVVVCDRRGEHRFGPAHLRSGDPVGWRTDHRTVPGEDRLLVYPKVFELVSVGASSRVPLGSDRAPRVLLGDPSRVAGVRTYRPCDPLRQVDWRATARSGELLVRVFEPTASLRTAVFLDTRVPQLGRVRVDPPELEFVVAVTASVVAHLHGHDVAVGLFSNGSVAGRPLARGPSGAPDALAAMLELLARASPFGSRRFAELLPAEAGRLPNGTSLVVVAADFPDATLAALGELRRRRVSVTALGILTGEGRPLPPARLVERCLTVEYHDDWAGRERLELAG